MIGPILIVYEGAVAGWQVFIERLRRSLKHGDIYLEGYADGYEARDRIAFYNTRRPHQALDNRTPVAM